MTDAFRAPDAGAYDAFQPPLDAGSDGGARDDAADGTADANVGMDAATTADAWAATDATADAGADGGADPLADAGDAGSSSPMDASDGSNMPPIDALSLADASDVALDGAALDAGPVVSSRGRLFVVSSTPGDGGLQRFTEVIDLDDGTRLSELPNLRLQPDPRGQFGIFDDSRAAVDPGMGYVDPGVRLENGAIVKEQPRVLPFRTPSTGVLNVHIGTELIGVFSDPTGIARFVDTTPLPEAEPTFIEIDSNGGLGISDPDSVGGQAIAWGDDLFVSVLRTVAGIVQPVALRRFDRDGTPREEYPCYGLGFAAFTADIALANCSDGFLRLRREPSGIVADRLPLPSDSYACFQLIGTIGAAGTIAQCSDASTFVRQNLVRIDPALGTVESLPMTALNWTVGLTGGEPPTYAVSTLRDLGDAVAWDLATGAEARRAVRAVEPWTMFANASWLATSGDRVYVTYVSPTADAPHSVRELDFSTDPPTLLRTFPLRGRPGRLVVLGAIP